MTAQVAPLTGAEIAAMRKLFAGPISFTKAERFFANDAVRLLDELERTREALRELLLFDEESEDWGCDSEKYNAVREAARAVLPPDAM